MTTVVQWGWNEWLQSSYFTTEELALFCVAEANQQYREGLLESPITDKEYDDLCELSKAYDITNLTGTTLNIGVVLFILNRLEEHTYMSDRSRAAQNAAASAHIPKPSEPSVFSQLCSDYAAYRRKEYGSDHPPKDLKYDTLRQMSYRVWDTSEGKMDYGVIIHEGYILIPAQTDDNPADWQPEEVAFIADKYYFRMLLDEYFILMQSANHSDSKDNLLYEGDLVKDSSGKIYYVVFDRFWKRWVLSIRKPEEWTPFSLSISINYASVTFKIGDIYTNPDIALMEIYTNERT